MSTTFIDRFKRRFTAPETLDVSSGGAVFTIKQFAWAEIEEAKKRTEMELIKAGVSIRSLDLEFLHVRMLEGVTDAISRHVAKIVIDGQVIPETQHAEVFAVMSALEKAVFASDYLSVAEAETKKNAVASPQNSESSSSVA